MTWRQWVATVVSVLAIAAVSAEALPVLRVTPDELLWRTLSSGVQRSAMVGHDTLPGLYVQRIRFPGGLQIAPHRHPDDRVVTVISGTIWVGYGSKFEDRALKRMPAGSVWTEPAGQAHFARVPDGTVELQIVGRGPSAVEPIGR